jgi:uncharacterized membrane protein
MLKLLVAASMVWPLVLAAAVWDGVATRGGSVWTHVVYAAASRVCHQRAERSFYTADVKWPVCGRCSGLYLAAPFGAVAAAAVLRGRRHRSRAVDRRLVLLAIAALPTLITVGVEWVRAWPITTLARCLAALPLGAAVAFVIVTTLRDLPGRSRPIEYTDGA